jgi:aminoglycoside phosphotransferase
MEQADHRDLLDWLATCGVIAPAACATVTRMRSGESNVVLRIDAGAGLVYVKSGPSLTCERQRLQWLGDRLPVPRVLAWRDVAHRHDLVLTALPGEDLAEGAKTEPPERIAELLAVALAHFHATATAGCPFFNSWAGTSLVHGDACLPNVLYSGDSITGFIDVGDSGLGDVETDLAAAVWSLQYNLGPGYGPRFLRAYGLASATEDEAERLLAAYRARESYRA